MLKKLFLCFSCLCAFLYAKEEKKEFDYDSGDVIPTSLVTHALPIPAQISLDNAWDLYADGGFLFWQAHENGLAFGEVLLTSQSSKVKDYNVEFSFKPGFFVELGKKFSYDNWNVFASYQRLHLTDDVKMPEGGLSFTPYWVDTGSNSYVLNNNPDISGFWRLRYDAIALYGAKPFYIGNALILTPNFGLQGLFIHQKYGADYSFIGGAIYQSSSWAVGPRMRLDLDWLLSHGFKITSKLGVGVFYQALRLQANIHQYVYDPAYSVILRVKPQNVAPEFQVGGGLCWGTYLKKNRWYIDFFAEYEFRVYAEQNWIQHYLQRWQISGNNDSSIQSLQFQGMNLGMRLDF